MESKPASNDGHATPGRLWAEQLAIGMALFVGILIFMALFHPRLLSIGAAVLGPNDVDAYGWMSALGIFLQIVVHELGTLLMAWRLKLPIRFRFFGFGANATAILENVPRRVWTDAAIGLAGPATGTLVSLGLAGAYLVTVSMDSVMHTGYPLLLGMACVGYFYNLFTLIPILDLEGGWVAPAIAPQAWLLGIVICILELTHNFNLILLGIVSFAVPRLVLLLRARAPREDLAGTAAQRVIVNLGYFILVIGLAYLSSLAFQELPQLVHDSMGD